MTNNVPKLRFEEFTDEWEIKSLKSITDRLTRKNKNLETNNPLTISAQQGLISQTDFFNKVIASDNLKDYYLLKKGEFAYNKSYSNEYPYGAIKRLDLYNEGAISTLYICFTVNDYVDSDFLTIYFESDKWYKEIYKIAVEGARNHGLLNIGVNDFFNTKHNIPSLDEQKKISSFLMAVDKKLKLLNDKKTNFLKFKKYLLQNMFPQNDEKTPKLRFKQFIEEWKTYLLKDLGCLYRGHSYNSSNVVESGLLVLRSNNIQNNKLNFDEKELQFVNKACKKEINLKTNDIVICMSNGTKSLVGKTAQYNGEYDGDITVGAFCSIFRSENILSKYIFQIESFKRYLYILLAGTNINNIKNSDLEKFQVVLPSIKEQEEIASFLSSVDKKIDLLNQEIEQVEEYKKGLLQKMFI